MEIREPASIEASAALRLKTTPPRIQRDLLARPRLLLGAGRFGDAPAILVHAPGGYGKTSLLAQWRRECLGTGAVVLWLAATPGDAPRRLLGSLVLGFRDAACRPSFGQSLLAAPPDPVEGLTEWLAEVARSALGLHLHFREGFLDAEEIERWDREGVWPRPHWPSRKPLVVGTSPMTGLVRPFVDGGASGVISPEVAVPQDMAGWVTGMVLARLAAGFSAGEALRLTRWEMLSRGNVMGLAYTLHAGADLRLR